MMSAPRSPSGAHGFPDVRPGTGFHVVNLGCKVNRVESDSIMAALISRGGVSVPLEDADVVVVNTCTVTGEADKKARKAVRHALLAAPRALVFVTGCSVAIDPQKYESMDGRVATVQRADVLASLSDSSSGSRLRMGEGFRTRVPVKVQDGCDRACTYCIVHVARGPARSVPFPDVLAEADRYLSHGTKEIVLTGIDLGSYESGGADLARLVEAVIELADKRAPAGERPARVRASSLEPHSLDEGFIDLLASSGGRLCRHVHLPLQSGSTKVLREMARPYTAEGFSELVAALRERVPQLALTTDVICGFPGEDPDEFQETLDMVERCRFSKVHVFPYSRREGTPAAGRPDQVSPDAKASRCGRLRELEARLRADDLARRAGSVELAVVEGATALAESYHELPAPQGAATGSLVPVRFPVPGE